MRRHEAGAGRLSAGAAPRPWGAHRPGILFRGLLAASRAVPQVPVVKQLAFLVRRMARRVVRDPVDVRHEGLRLRLRTRGNISESTFLFMPRRWDCRERSFLAAELATDATFVDVGANAGGYVWCVLALLGEGGRVVAVEPDPALQARLRFNLETNRETRVTVVGAAVAARSGEGWLVRDPDNRGQNALSAGDEGVPCPEGDGGDAVPAGTGEEPGADMLRVPLRPLPEILQEAGVTRVDALKIDVEGLEPEILADFFERAPQALWPRLVLTELQATQDHDELCGRLDRLGYRVALRTRLNLGLIRE